MNHASFEVIEFKADADGPSGFFAALVSAFNVVDRVGDKVIPGAFLKTIADKIAKSARIPVVLSHQHGDPDSYLGWVEPADVKETPKGLVVSGRFDMSNPKAAKVFDLMQKGLIRDWSFAYRVIKEKMGKDRSREILEAELFEVGPTLIGANGETATLALKELGVTEAEVIEAEDDIVEEKAGRALSAKNSARLREALDILQDFLAETSAETSVPEEASAEPEAKEAAPVAAEVTTPGDELTRELQAAGLFLAERS